MSQHTGSVPDTLEPAGQWVKQAACRGAADAMFPGTLATEIEYAKSFCRGCPVVELCGRWALDTRIEYGVWGGMSEKERTSLLRQKQRGNLTPEAVTARAQQARQPARPRTLQSVLDANTARMEGGHLAWTGPHKVSVRGVEYTPKQLSFALDRGHYACGRVFVRCGISECVLPAHLADQEERARWRSPAKASA